MILIDWKVICLRSSTSTYLYKLGIIEEEIEVKQEQRYKRGWSYDQKIQRNYIAF